VAGEGVLVNLKRIDPFANEATFPLPGIEVETRATMQFLLKLAVSCEDGRNRNMTHSKGQAI